MRMSHVTHDIWMSHVTYKWVMSHTQTDLLWCTAMSYCPHEWVMSHMDESCHVWISHVTHYIWMSNVIYGWCMSHINESCHTPKQAFAGVPLWATAQFLGGARKRWHPQNYRQPDMSTATRWNTLLQQASTLDFNTLQHWNYRRPDVVGCASARCTRTYARSRTHAHRCTYTHICPYTHTCMHTHTHLRAHFHTLIHFFHAHLYIAILPHSLYSFGGVLSQSGGGGGWGGGVCVEMALLMYWFVVLSAIAFVPNSKPHMKSRAGWPSCFKMVRATPWIEIIETQAHLWPIKLANFGHTFRWIRFMESPVPAWGVRANLDCPNATRLYLVR